MASGAPDATLGARHHASADSSPPPPPASPPLLRACQLPLEEMLLGGEALTAMAAHQEFVVVGTTHGRVLVLSLDGTVLVALDVSERTPPPPPAAAVEPPQPSSPAPPADAATASPPGDHSHAAIPAPAQQVLPDSPVAPRRPQPAEARAAAAAPAPVTTLAVSPQGCVAVGSTSGAVTLWDWRTLVWSKHVLLADGGVSSSSSPAPTQGTAAPPQPPQPPSQLLEQQQRLEQQHDEQERRRRANSFSPASAAAATTASLPAAAPRAVAGPFPNTPHTTSTSTSTAPTAAGRGGSARSSQRPVIEVASASELTPSSGRLFVAQNAAELDMLSFRKLDVLFGPVARTRLFSGAALPPALARAEDADMALVSPVRSITPMDGLVLFTWAGDVLAVHASTARPLARLRGRCAAGLAIANEHLLVHTKHSVLVFQRAGFEHEPFLLLRQLSLSEPIARLAFVAHHLVLCVPTSQSISAADWLSFEEQLESRPRTSSAPPSIMSPAAGLCGLGNERVALRSRLTSHPQHPMR